MEEPINLDSPAHPEYCKCSWCRMPKQVEEDEKKAKAILEAIRYSSVGDDIIVHNPDGSVWCILTLKTREHEH